MVDASMEGILGCNPFYVGIHQKTHYVWNHLWMPLTMKTKAVITKYIIIFF